MSAITLLTKLFTGPADHFEAEVEAAHQAIHEYCRASLLVPECKPQLLKDGFSEKIIDETIRRMYNPSIFPSS